MATRSRPIVIDEEIVGSVVADADVDLQRLERKSVDGLIFYGRPGDADESGARTLAWDDRHAPSTPTVWDAPSKRWNGER